MGMFAQQIADAKPTEGSGLYFEPGQYVVQLKVVKQRTSQNPKHPGAEMLIISTDILQSNCAARPAGMQDVAQILNSNHPSAKDDAKRFFCTLFPDAKPEQITAEVVDIVTSVEQPKAGTLLALECYHKQSEKTGKRFTKHLWRPVDAATAANAAELRAKAGLPPFKKA